MTRPTLIVSLLLLLPRLGLADVIPPAVSSCESKKLGDACTIDSKAGRCENGEQCRLDYSCRTDSGAPCGTICSPALVCKECKDCKDEGGCSLTPIDPADLGLGGLLLGLGLLLARRGR